MKFSNIVIVLIVTGSLGWLGWRIYSKASAEEVSSGRGGGDRAVPVEISPVTRQTIRNVAEFTGTLIPKSRVVIAPKVAGRLEKLMVNIGDSIKNGDLLALLDSDEYAQQALQAKAELEVSRANLLDTQSMLDVAVRDYERAKELHEQKVASEAELDEAQARYQAAKAKYDVAEAQIKQRDAALRAAEVRLSYARITASWSNNGSVQTVAERFVDEGSMLRANDPIVSIVDLSSVLAVINVIERDFPHVRIGQAATITTDAYPGRTFTGKVIRRAPILREETRQARVEIEIPNSDGLLAAGMFIRARIQFAEHEDATVVPITALVRREERQGVFLADTDQMKARFVPVEIGITEGKWVEITQPELQGLVVTLGQHLLEDDVSIVLPSASLSDMQAKEARP